MMRLNPIAMMTVLLLNPGMALAACEGREFAMFEPLIGQWEEYAVALSEREQVAQASPTAEAQVSRKLRGERQTQWVAGNCALQQTFVAMDEGMSFQSLAWRAANGEWQEVYVSDNGEVSQYRWSINEEELLLEETGKPGPDQKRLVIYDVSETGYYVLDERTSDRGASWIQQERVHVVRKTEDPAVNPESEAMAE